MTGGALLIEDAHFEYLRIQKGNLDEISRDRVAWHRHYEDDLERQFASIAPYLPPKCGRLLDVGSGLGGIDVLIRRHYEAQGQAPHVVLLDGLADPPRMRLHRETFNNMRVAKDFQVKNGLDPLRFAYWTPQTFGPGQPEPYDLVVSFGSWCFHYPPSTYLRALAKGGIHPGTIVILDVRTSKPAWFQELEQVFELVGVAAVKPKWRRCVFGVAS